MSQLLNYKLEGEGHTVVLIHGLFGNLDNLGLLARELKKRFQVLSIDLRNHGLSFHSDSHTYQQQAEDILSLLQYLNIQQCSIIGHSMGGKVAMKVTAMAQNMVDKLVVLDMAPVAYHVARHDNVIQGLKAVQQAQPAHRKEALEILAQHIEMEGVRQFLGKSLYKNHDHFSWRFNVDSLQKNYWDILDWETVPPVKVPTLFIKGGESDYLTAEHQPLVKKQFVNAKAHVISNTGHWLHAEKPAEVLRAITKFFT